MLPFDQTQIPKLYQEGYSVRQIQKVFGYERWKISDTIKASGIDVQPGARSGRRSSHFANENVFDVIDEAAAYWVGFLMADGNVTEAGQITVSLCSEDHEHLLKLKTFLGCNTKPVIRPNSTHPHRKVSSLSLRSKKLKDALNQYGVRPRKSKDAKVADSLSLNRHFWRGVLDGDGYISQPGSPLRVELCGSKCLCHQFCDFLESIGITERKVEPMRSIYRVRLAKKHSLILLQNLYSDASQEIVLSRKQKTAWGHLHDH